MIRLNAKVFVMGSPRVIESICPSALLLAPLISVRDASLYVSRVAPPSRSDGVGENYAKYAAPRQIRLSFGKVRVRPATRRKRRTMKTMDLGHRWMSPSCLLLPTFSRFIDR